MKVAIIGAGLSGCTVAHILAGVGNDIHIFDNQKRPGGLARTATTTHGRIYEPFGNHSFHTKNKFIWNWVNNFVDFRHYEHRKGIMLFNGNVYRYPLHLTDIQSKFPVKISNKISYELSNVNFARGQNFKECVINMIGPTLYELTVENYTRGQWGCEPEELLPNWAPKRIEIRGDGDDRLFRDEYQGVPKLGYSYMCSQIIKHTNITYTSSYHISAPMARKLMDDFDIVLCSGPIDEIIGGNIELPYRGAGFIFDFDIKKEIKWEDEKYGTINFNTGDPLRKINFGVIHDQYPLGPVAVQIPSPEGKFYPVITNMALGNFDRLLDICCRWNFIPFGRLGGFKYLNMDEAIHTAMEVAMLAKHWCSLHPSKRKAEWLKIYPKEI